MKRVLFVGFLKPGKILEGGGMANLRNLEMIRQIIGADNVETVYIHEDKEKRSWRNLLLSAFWFPMGYFNGVLPSRVKTIVKKAQEYDCVFLSTSLLGMVAKHLKEAGYEGQVVAHFHNVESMYYESRVSKRMPLRRIVIRCAWRNDGWCCKYADTVVTLNERDSRMLKNMYGRGADILAPIALKDKCKDMQFNKDVLTESRPRCLFLGSYFPANKEGVLWFMQNVFPHVDIEFKIVGKGMSKLKEEVAWADRVEIVSDVPDLTPYLLEADFMILPIFSGSGMKVKTCESLMYGKNILGTNEAFEGYALDTDKVGGRCNNAEEFISRLRYFAAHPVLRYNTYSREAYEHDYSESSSKEIFCRILEMTSREDVK